MLGKSVSQTGLEVYSGTFKCFTNRNNPKARDYQQTHEKVTLSERPSQFFVEVNDTELTVHPRGVSPGNVSGC